MKRMADAALRLGIELGLVTTYVLLDVLAWAAEQAERRKRTVH